MQAKSLSLLHYIQSSVFLRVVLIGFVILLLQIPISMIDSQITARQETKREAVSDITSKWGRKQTVIAPRLIVPFTEIKQWRDDKNKTHTSRIKHFATFLPENLTIQARTSNEVRKRGLFEVPVYQSNISISGTFNKPIFDRWSDKPELIHWEQAEIAMGVSDVRATQKQVNIKWNNEVIAFEPGLGLTSLNNAPGLHARITSLEKDKVSSFKITMQLNGSKSLFFAPMGKNSDIQIDSDWPHPSFQGYKLPNQRTVREDGFSANWSVSQISRNYPQQWLGTKFYNKQFNKTLVGVDFISPVDSYRMTDRSSKYVMLFLLLTFTVIWLIEVLTRIRVHLLQYLFIGLGMCMFYLLLLALSEHIGFSLAYLTASLAVVILCAGYAKAVLKTKRNAIIIGSSIAILYLYLFTLLHEQSYSLLFGSLGVFIGLAVVMYSTRNIDWYDLVNVDKKTMTNE